MKHYQRKTSAISGKLEDELVIMDINQGKYFSLNPVATRIWEILEQPMELISLCDLLREEFEVEPEQCKIETTECLNELIKIGLVQEIG